MNTGDVSSRLEYERIAYLLNPEELSSKLVTAVGLGSGGAPVCDHLSMNGVRRWHLYDPDILELTNLVKHPRMRHDIGRPKVDIQRDWLLDRNPSSEVAIFQEDVMKAEYFDKSIQASDLVLVCPDSKAVREFVSDKCVAFHKPFVVASVFRTGIGGEIFGYQPNETGCYRCLQLYSLLSGSDLTDDELGLTPEEENRIYGLNDREFRASGLSIDIQMISLIQARMALSYLLRSGSSKLPSMKANWVIFGNRPAPNIFRQHFQVTQILLKPQAECNCTQNG